MAIYRFALFGARGIGAAALLLAGAQAGVLMDASGGAQGDMPAHVPGGGQADVLAAAPGGVHADVLGHALAATPAREPGSACPGLAQWRDHSAAPPHWAISSAAADTAEITDTGTTVFDAILLSPTIRVPADGLQLRWQQHSRLSWANSAGVLEIRIGSGEWKDITVAGGHFLAGGYDHRSFAGNPLGARPAWGGEDYSGETLAELPAISRGQLVQLRFRLGSSGTGDLRPGWRISGLTCGGQR